MATIRTLKAARERFPRGEFVRFARQDEYPGCELKVWTHRFGPTGEVELGGYLYRVSYDADGALVRRAVFSSAQMGGATADALASEVRRA